MAKTLLGSFGGTADSPTRTNVYSDGSTSAAGSGNYVAPSNNNSGGGSSNRSGGSTTTTPTTIKPYNDTGGGINGFIDYLAQNNILTDNSAAGVDKAKKAYAASNLNTNQNITEPPKPTVTNPFSSITAGNYGLGLSDASGNPVTKAPDKTTTTVDNTGVTTTATTTSPYMDTLKSILGLREQNPVPNLTNEYLKAEKSSGVQALQQIVNDKTAQLNAITAKATADQLKLRGVGANEGVTEAVYGGQQAQIAREAAIQALPLQAEIAAAQGNLEFAQNRLDTLFKLKSQDAQNQFDYKNKVIDWIYDAASKDQQNQLDQKRLDDKQAHDDTQRNIDRQDSWAKLALDSGQSTLISLIHNIDPSSSTFNSQLAAVTGKISGNTLDNQYKELQIKKLQQELTGTGEDSAQVLAYAQQYASTGTIPTGLPKGSFGIVSQVAKELPKSPGQILDKATGVSPDKLGAAGDAYGALYSAIELSKQLKELDNKRIGGIVSGTLGKVFGSEDQQRYVDLRGQIVDLLSRARSGAALTTTEEKRYSDMLPGRFSEPFGLGVNSDTRIDNFTNALSSDLINKTNSKGWVVNGLSTVKLGGKDYVVGQIIDVNGQQGRVNPDGTITAI